jgi:hypothetical protein
MRIYNNFYLFLESVVSPTAVGEEKGRRRRDPGVRRERQWGAEKRWRSAMLGRNIFD